MGWTFTEDVETYAEQTNLLLSEHAVECTLPLSIVAGARVGGYWPEGAFGGWYTDAGTIRGAVLHTPPYELVLAVVPESTMAELAERLRTLRPDLPGAHGSQSDVERFTAGYLEGTDRRATPILRLRLYLLGELATQQPQPSGKARPATVADLDLLRRWTGEFLVETDMPPDGAEASILAQLRDGVIMLWEDVDPETAEQVAVSMAACRAAVAGVSRVGPVYTPPRYRKRGYGAAVTAAVSAEAIRRGADQVALFTDLANPVSNSIYQQIGYRPVSDRLLVKFEP